MKQIGDIMCNGIELFTPTITKHKGKTIDWYTMRFNSYRKNNINKRHLHYKFLYENSEFYLKRKKSKFDNFFKSRGKSLI